MKFALQIQNLSMVYAGNIAALNPVSLEISGSGVTVLLGRSGAGKSTLLRCMNLLCKPTTGTLHTSDLGLITPRNIRKHRQHTGMIFQQHQLLRRETALHNVLTGRLSRYGTLRSLLPLPKEDRFLALQCLERVGLLHKALKRCDQLSGGEQQRVGIARALAQQPRLLLADEPVASLDPRAANDLLSLLRGISRQDGIAVVVSLHQVSLARSYGDRIIGIKDGTVICDAAASDFDHDMQQSVYGATSSACAETSESFTSAPIPSLGELAHH